MRGRERERIKEKKKNHATEWTLKDAQESDGGVIAMGKRGMGEYKRERAHGRGK